MQNFALQQLWQCAEGCNNARTPENKGRAWQGEDGHAANNTAIKRLTAHTGVAE
jgi:hypothetical protein